MTAQDKLRALIRAHCTTIRQSVSQIELSLSRLHEQQTRQPEVIEESRWLTHQLKGSSGSIGFREVSDAAAILDQFLVSISGPDRVLTDPELRRIADLYTKLNEAASDISPERSVLYNVSISGPGKR